MNLGWWGGHWEHRSEELTHQPGVVSVQAMQATSEMWTSGWMAAVLRSARQREPHKLVHPETRAKSEWPKRATAQIPSLSLCVCVSSSGDPTR